MTAVLLVFSLMLVMVGTPVAARDDRPTIVLVHGAWAGPAAWDQVVSKLHDDGYRTATPTLGLQTLDADVATVRATLDGIPGTKILVGHSYGGAVISNAAAGRTDVLGLVYTAAFAPDEGESLEALGQGYPLPDAFKHLICSDTHIGPSCTIDPAVFPRDFAQDLPAKQAAVLNAEHRAFNLGIFGTPSGPVAWHTLPSWYAVSGADRMIDPALERAMAKRIGATTITFADASHAGGFTLHADRFAALIEQAADSTTGG
jgi:pimeloyl-ACP methyl ester carboxylesterase